MGTSVRLAHDCNNSNSAGSPDGFGLEEGGEFVLVVIGESTDDLDQFGGFGDFVLFGFKPKGSFELEDNFNDKERSFFDRLFERFSASPVLATSNSKSSNNFIVPEDNLFERLILRTS